jgi:hypothetical protein
MRLRMLERTAAPEISHLITSTGKDHQIELAATPEFLRYHWKARLPAASE